MIVANRVGQLLFARDSQDKIEIIGNNKDSTFVDYKYYNKMLQNGELTKIESYQVEMSILGQDEIFYVKGYTSSRYLQCHGLGRLSTWFKVFTDGQWKWFLVGDIKLLKVLEEE